MDLYSVGRCSAANLKLKKPVLFHEIGPRFADWQFCDYHWATVHWMAAWHAWYRRTSIAWSALSMLSGIQSSTTHVTPDTFVVLEQINTSYHDHNDDHYHDHNHVKQSCQNEMCTKFDAISEKYDATWPGSYLDLNECVNNIRARLGWMWQASLIITNSKTSKVTLVKATQSWPLNKIMSDHIEWNV